MAAPSNTASPDLPRIMRAMTDALRNNDRPGACRIAGEAVARGIENAPLLVHAAFGQIGSGNDPAALVLALRARARAPHDLDVLTTLATCYMRNHQLYDAVETYDAALRISPGLLTLRFAKACALESLSEPVKAQREFERVLDASPGHSATLTHLADIAARKGDVAAARDYAARALQSDPRQDAALLTLGAADVEESKYEDAIARLKSLTADSNPSPVNRSIALGLTGDALDGLDRIDEAFGAYKASKVILRSLYRPQMEAPGTEAFNRITRLQRYFQSAPQEQWRVGRDSAANGPVQTHVFLVGFPRSGTTLLEQILASHPDVVAMEERDCFLDSETAFLQTPEGLGRLAAMTGDDLTDARDAYWKRVTRAGLTPSKPVFIDKMPLNTILLCFVAKLFPQAKILFALRDPRDVVLSCFRHRFRMNPQMYELVSLAGAAKHYDAVMRLAKTYREKLSLDIRDLRYEALVVDMETEMRGVCGFLGLTWDDAMHSFAQRARERGINTPSAAQVARGLYADGAGQWRRYVRHITPVLPQLAPWVAQYGYTD